MLGLAFVPYLFARVVDDGLRPGRFGVLAAWVGVLLAVGLLTAGLSILRHRAMTRIRVDASFRTQHAVVRQVTRRGTALERRTRSGEVLADPHTLVLDEATAMLDPRTARRTERELATIMAGRTVVAIAHRLHTAHDVAHDADRVAVMDAGRIVELGPHDELVAARGAYAGLWRAWHG